MSLHVGHLSPHIGQEDLERVFQRFGRCHIQLKDGYGFVIYDVTANAEKALRILRGKSICGEQISLSWSNRQPWPFRSAASRFYEPDQRRNFKGEHKRAGARAMTGQKDFESGDQQIRTDLANDVLDRAAGSNGDGIDDLGKGKIISPKRRGTNEDVAVEFDPLVNDRWGEPVGESMAGHSMANEVEFDLYEPYSGFNRGNCKEKNQLNDSFSSLGQGKLEHPIDKHDKHVGEPKVQLACYSCGLVGHMARNCARGNDRCERFSKFNHRRDEINAHNRGERRLKSLRSNSWGRPDAARDPSIHRQHGKDTKECRQSKDRQMSSRSESSSDSKEKHHHEHSAEAHIEKKRKKKRAITAKVQKKRKSQRSISLSLSSDSSSASSRLISQPMRSVSDASPCSSSKSGSSGSHSVYTSSRSTSRSSYTRSVSLKSKSRSFSRLPSLSVSLHERSPISLKNELVDVSLSSSPQKKLENVRSPYLRHLPFANVKNSNLKGTIPISTDNNVLASVCVDSKTNCSHPGHDCDSAQYSGRCCDLMEGKSATEQQKVVADASAKRFENSREISSMLRRSSQELNGCLPISSVRITSKEMFLALRHYGLIAHDESELGVSGERYFGAARLWPWEMIYFRRMKKGPISTDNYARRLEQNREFGIVDKYIRSSSGWGECSQMNEDGVP